MIITDSHCHVSLFWYEPVESLLYQMDRNGVQHAVLVQMFGNTDNEYQFECISRFHDRFSTVVLIDTDDPAADQHIAYVTKRGASGVRMRASARSFGKDPFAIWRLIAASGLVADCMGNVNDFASDEFFRLVQELPDLLFVLEHLGGLGKFEGIDEICNKVLTLARFPNVYIKIPGLGEVYQRNFPVTHNYPFAENGSQIFDKVYKAFGAERMMWGSDYPVVSSREGYSNSLNFTMDKFFHKNEEDRALIFGKTAMHVYRFFS